MVVDGGRRSCRWPKSCGITQLAVKWCNCYLRISPQVAGADQSPGMVSMLRGWLAKSLCRCRYCSSLLIIIIIIIIITIIIISINQQLILVVIMIMIVTIRMTIIGNPVSREPQLLKKDAKCHDSMGRTKDAETANNIILFSPTLGGRPDARPRRPRIVRSPKCWGRAMLRCWHCLTLKWLTCYDVLRCVTWWQRTTSHFLGPFSLMTLALGEDCWCGRGKGSEGLVKTKSVKIICGLVTENVGLMVVKSHHYPY